MKVLFAFVLSICIGSSCTGVKRPVTTNSYHLHYLGDKVESTDGVSDSTLVGGYKVMKTRALQDSDVKVLRDALEKAKEQDDVVKRCPFEPVYALTANDTLLLLFDMEYCPRMEDLSVEVSKMYELKSDNNLKKIVDKLFQ